MSSPALRDPTAAERASLEAFLDEQRLELAKRVRGASERDARRHLVDSATTLGGLVKHLCWVEKVWFTLRLEQVPREEWPWPWPLDEDPDAGFRLLEQETVPGLLEHYGQACARSRKYAAQYELDHVVPHERHGEVSLRWIYLHMIEETARHAGHADILREQLDQLRGEA